jgi:hypothetical protein
MKQGIWCNPNIIRYNHDLDKAREYMELAGFDIPTQTQPPTSITTTQEEPGFGLWLALGTIVAIGTATVLVKRKRK